MSEKSDELLQCFCGGFASPDPCSYGRKFRCSNEACEPLYFSEMYPQDWNALQSAVAAIINQARDEGYAAGTLAKNLDGSGNEQ